MTKRPGLILIIILSATLSLQAQTLKEQITAMFGEVLNLELSPGEHKDHFLPASVAANQSIMTSLTNFIGTSVSSLPLSSSSAGVTFDFSTGRPVPTSTSFGPIYSERAQTLGRNRFHMMLNYTFLDYSKLRGISTDDLRLTFTHEDVGAPGMGDSPNESDIMDFYMHLNLTASVFAFYFNYGVTDRLDIGVGIPFNNVKMKTNPYAVIDSYTFVSNDSANHYFDGTTTEPILSKSPTPINDDATGVGDIVVRAKYNFIREKLIDFSVMADYRFASGDAENFLGAGFSTWRVTMIGSKIMGDFAPHLNLAYWNKDTDQDRDEFQFAVGFDQKVADWFTLVVDVLGGIELGQEPESTKLPDDVVITRTINGLKYVTVVPLTNIPNYHQDNVINASFGAKFRLKESLLVMANVIAPLNDSGLRADVLPTIGIESSF